METEIIHCSKCRREFEANGEVATYLCKCGMSTGILKIDWSKLDEDIKAVLNKKKGFSESAVLPPQKDTRRP
jgi:hypothetical protein